MLATHTENSPESWSNRQNSADSQENPDGRVAYNT